MLNSSLSETIGSSLAVGEVITLEIQLVLVPNANMPDLYVTLSVQADNVLQFISASNVFNGSDLSLDEYPTEGTPNFNNMEFYFGEANTTSLSAEERKLILHASLLVLNFTASPIFVVEVFDDGLLGPISDSVSLMLSIVLPSLSLSQVTNATQVESGDRVEFALTLLWSGGPAYGVRILESLPHDMTIVTGSVYCGTSIVQDLSGTGELDLLFEVVATNLTIRYQVDMAPNLRLSNGTVYSAFVSLEYSTAPYGGISFSYSSSPVTMSLLMPIFTLVLTSNVASTPNTTFAVGEEIIYSLNAEIPRGVTRLRIEFNYPTAFSPVSSAVTTFPASGAILNNSLAQGSLGTLNTGLRQYVFNFGDLVVKQRSLVVSQAKFKLLSTGVASLANASVAVNVDWSDTLRESFLSTGFSNMEPSVVVTMSNDSVGAVRGFDQINFRITINSITPSDAYSFNCNDNIGTSSYFIVIPGYSTDDSYLDGYQVKPPGGIFPGLYTFDNYYSVIVDSAFVPVGSTYAHQIVCTYKGAPGATSSAYKSALAQITVQPASFYTFFESSFNWTSGNEVGIGEEVSFYLKATIPAGLINLVITYDLTGTAKIEANSIEVVSMDTDLIDGAISSYLQDFNGIPDDLNDRAVLKFGANMRNSAPDDADILIKVVGTVVDTDSNKAGLRIVSSAQTDYTYGSETYQQNLFIVEPNLTATLVGNRVLIEAGHSVFFTVTLQHSPSSSASAFDIVVSCNLTSFLVSAGNVSSNVGTITSGSAAGDSTVEVVADNLAVNTSLTVTFSAEVTSAILNPSNFTTACSVQYDNVQGQIGAYEGRKRSLVTPSWYLSTPMPVISQSFATSSNETTDPAVEIGELVIFTVSVLIPVNVFFT